MSQQGISAKDEKIAKLNEQIAEVKEQQRTQATLIRKHKKEMSKDRKLENAGSFFFVLTGIMVFLLLYIYEEEWLRFPDVAIIGLVLVCGIILRIMSKAAITRVVNKYGSWKDAKQAGKDLQKELEKLQRKQARLERAIDLENGNPDALKVYRGKDWNMRNFKAKPQWVKEMELDVENLFIASKYIAGSSGLSNNWMCRSRQNRYKAIKANKTERIEQYDAGFMEMAKSGSWKLRVAQIVMLTLDTALMDPSFSMSELEIFKDLYTRANVPAPETEEQKEFYQNAMIAAMLMGGAVQTMEKFNNGIFD